MFPVRYLNALRSLRFRAFAISGIFRPRLRSSIARFAMALGGSGFSTGVQTTISGNSDSSGLPFLPVVFILIARRTRMSNLHARRRSGGCTVHLSLRRQDLTLCNSLNTENRTLRQNHHRRAHDQPLAFRNTENLKPRRPLPPRTATSAQSPVSVRSPCPLPFVSSDVAFKRREGSGGTFRESVNEFLEVHANRQGHRLRL